MSVAPSKLHSFGFEFLNVLDISDMYYQVATYFHYAVHYLSLSYNEKTFICQKNFYMSKFYIPTESVTNSYAGFIEALVTFLRNCSLSTGLKLNVLKSFRRRHGCFLNSLCVFNLHPLSRGWKVEEKIRSRLSYNRNSLRTNVLGRNLFLFKKKHIFCLIQTLEFKPQNINC